MRRRGMPLVAAAATTAVVAGTAGAVRHRQDQRYQAQANQQQSSQDQAEMAAQMDAMQQQQAALAQQQAALAQQQAQATQAAAAPAGGVTDDAIAQLQKLAELQKAGIITQQEFDAKKKQLLGL